LTSIKAVTSVPFAIFWKELVAAYPNAKAILTHRDTTEAWYKSYSHTIDHLTQAAYLKPSLAVRFFRLFLPSHGFDRLVKYQILYTPRGRFEAKGRAWYEQRNAAVIAGVPKESSCSST
jgi:Sulfotransferase domain